MKKLKCTALVLAMLAALTPLVTAVSFADTIQIDWRVHPGATEDNIVTSMDIYKTISSYETFSDVVSSDWYFETVLQAQALGLMSGYGNGSFGPTDSLTRAQIMQIMYNYYGSNTSAAATYSDVPSGEWYYSAVAWAQNKGLDEGIVTGNTFSPNASMTREEFVRVLYNLAGKPSINASVLNGFTDVNQISSFAKEAFAWAVDKGIITGTSTTTLSPTATLERSQAATMVIRYLRYIDNAEIPVIDADIIAGYRNLNGSTNTNYVNTVSAVGKKAEYPTIGQADKPNANGYYTEANVDIEGAVLVYEALDYTHEILGNYGMVWTTSDELEEYTLMRAKEVYAKLKAVNFDDSLIGYDDPDSELKVSLLHYRPDNSSIITAENISFYENDTAKYCSNNLFNMVIDGWNASPGHHSVLAGNNSEACIARYKNVWVMCVLGDVYNFSPIIYASYNYYGDSEEAENARADFLKQYPYFAYVGLK